MGVAAVRTLTMASPQVSALQIEAVPVLADNYVFLLSRGQQAALVDPAVAEPLIALLEARSLELVAVLQTHHHADHIGGTPALLERWPACRVYAAAADLERIPFQSDGVAGGDQFTVLEQPVQVLAVPGHTRAHVAYHLPLSADVFVGDTLFVAGCGRLFEGTPLQLWTALQRLTALPPETRLWCAHEYSAANLRWAIEQVPAAGPLAQALKQRLAQVQQLRSRGLPSVPTTVASERATNLFVQAQGPEQLAQLRGHKDTWRG